MYKKIKYSSILFLIMFLFFCSCQSTPETLVVQKKDGEELMEIIENGENFESIMKETKKNEFEQIDIENSWQEKIVSDNGKFICNIDANIILQESGEFPVIKVKPYEFSAKDMYHYLNILAPEAKLLVYGDGTPEVPMTKTEIENAILHLKRELNDKNSVLNQMKETNYEQYEERKLVTESEIQELEEMHKTAPEEINVKYLEITEELMQQGFMATTKKQLSYQNTKDATDYNVTLKVSDSDAYGGRVNGFSLIFSFIDEKDSEQDFAIEDAVESAYGLLRDLGFENMEYCYSEVENNIYEIIFMRSYENVTTNYTEQDVGFEDFNLSAYSLGWPNEKITIQYTNNGLLKRFKYKYPLYEVEILNSNVEIISYEKIQNIFRQQIINEGMWIENEKVLLRTYYINTIKLGMMRISLEDNVDEFIVVPVWDFYGYSVEKFDSQDDVFYNLNDNGEYVSKAYPYSFLTINAIDGSIIDRTLGY